MAAIYRFVLIWEFNVLDTVIHWLLYELHSLVISPLIGTVEVTTVSGTRTLKMPMMWNE